MGRRLLQRPQNGKLQAARERLLSPSGSGRPLSRQELAEALNAFLWETYEQEENLDENDIGKLERGVTRWPSERRREAFRAVLHAKTDTELGFYIVRGMPSFESGPTTVEVDHNYGGPVANCILARIRTVSVTRRWPELDAPAPELADVAGGVRAAHDAYQRADYAVAGRLLPRLIAAGEHLVRHSSGEAQQRAHRALAMGNIAVSKLAAKLGDGELAWVTADRAASSAVLSGDQMIGAVAAYQIACALLRLSGRLDGAVEAVAVASDELDQRGETDAPVDLSVRGALLLLGAIAAARQGDRAAVARHFDRAQQLAAKLGHDGNHLFTGFGPTNLMIHQVSIAVELLQPDKAVQIGDRLDTSRLPAVLVSRRAQVHLDLASAYAQITGGDSAAVLHLLEVERIAPQVIGVHHTSRALLTALIARERRSATPGLRALALRAGVLT